MTTTISTRVRINGKNVVVKRTFEKGEEGTAFKELGDEARMLRKSAEAKIKSKKQGYRKKKARPLAE